MGNNSSQPAQAPQTIDLLDMGFGAPTQPSTTFNFGSDLLVNHGPAVPQVPAKANAFDFLSSGNQQAAA